MKRYAFLLAALALFGGAPAFGATCVVGEYGMLSDALNGETVQVAQGLITSQAVTYTTSTQSSAFNAATRFIRVVCDAKAHFKISITGANPTATANDQWVGADAPEYFGVVAGQKIAFYDGSST